MLGNQKRLRGLDNAPYNVPATTADYYDNNIIVVGNADECSQLRYLYSIICTQSLIQLCDSSVQTNARDSINTRNSL